MLGPSPALVRLTDHDVAATARPETFVRHASPLSEVLTQELDEAAEAVRSCAEEIVLAALGRTIGRTIGNGLTAIDLAGRHPLLLTCASEKLLPATDLLLAVRSSLATTAPALSEVPEMCIAFSAQVSESAVAPRHPIELRSYRSHRVLQLDWWYDLRLFNSYTVIELAEQFPLALIEVCSEVSAPILPEAVPSLICTAT